MRALRSTLRQQRGMALMIVLGLVVFLSIIALSFSESQRLASQIASNMLNAARSQAAADGAVHKMLYELSKPRVSDAQLEENRWKANGIAYEWTENGVLVSVSGRSEAAKIDVNFAAEALLKNLFVSAGVEDGEADSIVAAIRDWTDADILKRPNGAEADDYRAAGKKILPTNDFFVAVEELQNVMGMTPQLYLAVSPYLTVHSRSAGIDPQTAPLDVLLKIPNLDAGQVATWVETRDAALRDNIPVPPLTFSSPYFATGGGATRIRAEANTSDGVSASREATVRLGGAPGAHPQFYLWQKGSPTKRAPQTPAPVANNG
ncbi:MAG: general secretion pathway protein GspK [Casimicrobium sp.]